MNKPHKHAEVIKAWADGAEIEFFRKIDNKWVLVDVASPSWFIEFEYRIKPEPKPDVVRFTYLHLHKNVTALSDECMAGYNLKFTFDGETGKLKSAEVINND